jgi:hypothetical protein
MATATIEIKVLRGKSVRSKLVGLFLLVLAFSAVVGCGIDIGGNSGSNTKLTKITVTPNGAGIPVGLSQQFAAIGTLSDGTTRDLTSKVTWTANPTGLVTIDDSGNATAVATGSVTIKATSGSVSGSAGLTVNPAVLMSVSVTPLGPAIETGGTRQLTATGNFSDGSTVDVTATAVWNSSATGVATISAGGLVSGVSAGQTTITATSNSFAGVTAVNVVAPPSVAPVLNGNYGFSFTGVDERGPQYYAGTFHANAPDADGNGTIDSGEEDANTAAGITNSVLTGTYTIYPDGRGTLILTPGGQPSTTFRFVLTSGQATGLAVEFDGKGTQAGSFELQDDSAFSNAALNGNNVFRLNGIDLDGKTLGQVGLFTADGAGTITGGTGDESDFGVQSSIPTLTGSYDIAANGRGTLSLITPDGTSDFIVYVISGSKVNLIQVDAGTSVVLAGVAEKQASHTFANGDLAGGYAYLLNRAPARNPSMPSLSLATFDVIGRVSLDGHGAIVAGIQEEVGGVAQNNIQSGTYDVASNGRGVMSAATTAGPRTYTFYMVAPDHMYMLDNFSTWAGTGPVDQQAVTLTNSTLTGPYGMAGASVGENDTELTMWLSADGGGAMTGVADLIQAGVPSSVVVTASYSVAANGRTAVIPANPPVGAQSFVFYVVSSNKAQVLGLQPDLDGTFLLQ